MRSVSATFSTAAMIALSLSVAACGKSNSPVSPTTSASAAQPGPGAAPAPGGAITGASISGTVVAGSSSRSLGATPLFRTMSTGMTVSVVGTSMSTSVDGAGNFSLHNVPDGDDVLEFQAPGVDARMPIAGVTDHEDIHLSVIVNGTTADVDANERHTPDNRDEIEGRIASVNMGALTLMIGTTTISVPAGTPIEHGDGGTPIAFSALVAGERVHVHATMVGGIVTASRIEVETDNPGNPGPVVTPSPGNDDGNDNNGEVEGNVSARTGACPSISFSVSSTSVTTNGSTKFEDTTCAALANGDSVEVKGTRQTNGSILASSVEKK